MPVYIEMPKLSDTMTEGTLIKWLKKTGDSVEVGDILAEVETDKATMEMEAFDEGILSEIYVQEGQKVAVREKIAILLAPGENPPEKNSAPTPSSPASAESGSPSPMPSAKAPPSKASTPNSSSTGNGRVKASPLARKVAAEKGIDLSRLAGTGPGGRIVQRDVVAATGASAAVPSAPVNAPRIPPMKAGEGDQRIPLTGMRKTIAERLLISKTQIPHFYLNIEVDVAELIRIRAAINAAAEKAGQGKVTINDFVLKAAAAAAVKVPKVNAAFDGDAVIQYRDVNLSIAVAIEDGLVTPVIRSAQSKTLRDLSDSVKDLAARARGKKLKPEEFQGGTFTVSNLGSYGVDSFFAIINPPQSLILSIGAILKKPVVNAIDEIVVGQRMSIGMSCDHRVIDGAIGAEYLAEVRRLLENPALMLI